MGWCALLSVASAATDRAGATFIARDFTITGPDRIAGGITTIEMLNQGATAHHLQLVSLPAGKSADDLAAAIQADPKRLPSWIRYLGGPNAVVPGERTAATVHLESGSYVVLCLIPDEHGVPHYARGMQRPLRVEGGTVAHPVEPTGDVTLTQVDFAFGVSHPITHGPHTIQVVNRGTITHEAVLMRLAPGSTTADLLASLAPGAPAPVRGKPIGGIVGVEPGTRAYFTADFQPGTYVWICLFPDTETGAVHAARGMVTEFTVR
jgi:uncharacterized cupredoxin-like copper-binding protein